MKNAYRHLIFLSLIIGLCCEGKSAEDSVAKPALAGPTPVADHGSTSTGVVRQREQHLVLGGLPNQSITITIKSGVVTLEGELQSWEAHREALQIITSISGVMEIIDQIHIAPAVVPDATLQTKIQAVLRDDPATAGAELKVEVKNAAVTLSGALDDWLAKDLAGWRAGNISGVKSVENNITLPYLVRRDSAIRNELTEQIKTELSIADSDAGSRSPSIVVEVNEGIVTLSGAVSSLRDKRVAHNIAEGATGVKSVVDELVLAKSSELSDADLAARIHEALTRAAGA